MFQSGQLNIFSYQNANATEIQNVRLFACEELRAYLVVVPPGGAIADHVHADAHELFDVVEGEGIFVVDGRTFHGTAGKCVFVPAGVSHSIRNESDAPWTLRVTYQDQVSPRHIGKLIRRALRRRFA
jgi:mannose-6-phosphate isomerase-like protein (cupin superfamily)